METLLYNEFKKESGMKESILYRKLKDGKVQCLTCAHKCVISKSKRGICYTRENVNGVLYALNYKKLIARNIDPIEKKPLYHFFPASLSYSIATVGCNFRCLFCQNADISQMPREQGIIYGEEVEPTTLVEDALRHRCKTISYTYTEPTIFLEYAYDVMKLAKERGIYNVFVSNGYMSEETIELLRGFLDAINVDLKAFNDRFYKEQCGGRLEPVLRNIELLKKQGVWVEVTTLLIPGLNDDPSELRELARFLQSVDPNIPWHISRFHPAYRVLNIPPTPLETLRRAREIGLSEGLRFVYTGNVPGDEGENTYCPECSTILIRRLGFSTQVLNLHSGRCKKCNALIAGVWD